LKIVEKVVMNKIDRKGGGVFQKSFSRTDPFIWRMMTMYLIMNLGVQIFLQKRSNTKLN